MFKNIKIVSLLSLCFICFTATAQKKYYISVRDSAGMLHQDLVYIRISGDTLYAIKDENVSQYFSNPGSVYQLVFPVSNIKKIYYISPDYGSLLLGPAIGTPAGVLTGSFISGTPNSPGSLIPFDNHQCQNITIGCASGFAIGIVSGILYCIIKRPFIINGQPQKLRNFQKKLK